jgi:integrase
MGHIFLTEERIAIIMNRAKQSCARDYALLSVAACTALRASDLLRLRIADVVEEDGGVVLALRLKIKKTGKMIERPLREDARAALAAYIKERDDKNPYLFVSLPSANKLRRKQPLHRESYSLIIKKYLSEFYPHSVLQGCATHTLRRSVAKLVYKKSGRIEPATLLLGHSSPANTMRYIDSDDIRDTANGIVDSLQW